VAPVVFVGEVNPYAERPDLALFPIPTGAAGHRLMHHLGLWRRTYTALERVNLCAERWANGAARDRARGLLWDRAAPTVFVLLGVRVADAFDAPGPPYTYSTRVVHAQPGGHVLARLPHPSGRNLVWNAPDARALAREMLRELVPEVLWGETDAAAEALRKEAP